MKKDIEMLRSTAMYKAVSGYEKQYPTRMVYEVYITERELFFEINIKARDSHKKVYEDDISVWKRTISED